MSCPKEEASITETTLSETEGNDYESWETCDEDSHSSGPITILESRRKGGMQVAEGPDIEPKTIPVPSGTYKVVCLSFLDQSATAPVASKVFDESWRTLAPGGLLYVVDNRGIVSKVPKMRQTLSKVRQQTPKLKLHDARTREIMEMNGLDPENAFASAKKVVRWMGIKPPQSS